MPSTLFPLLLPARPFHCLDCEVAWVSEDLCFCCGRLGSVGNLPTATIVEAARSEGWNGPLGRPAAYRTAVARSRR